METWRPVVGFEDYEVSDQGRVRSLPRDLPARAGKTRRVKGKILSPSRAGEWGHVKVALGRGHQRTVHLIVLDAFVGPCPEGMECRHLNGIPDDNRLENLRWGTKLENAADKARHGTSSVGERNGMAKLTERQVLDIHARPHELLRVLADEHGVSEATICVIRQGKHWAHVRTEPSV